MRVVVIGGVAAGMSAASKLRRLRKDVEIIVFEKSNDLSYGACGMPYYLSGAVQSIDDLIAKRKEDFEKESIQVHLNHEVVKVNPKTKVVHVKHDNRVDEITYDRLIIATGASAIRLPVQNNHLNGIQVLNSLEDARALKQAIDDQRVQKIAVIGGGYIGLEVAENLREVGKDVLIIEREKSLLSLFDPMISDDALKTCNRHHVEVRLEETVQAYEGDTHVSAVVTDQGRYEVDLVIEAVGIKPNTGFLDASFKLSTNKAVIVDAYLKTNIDDVYAAGDCVAYRHQLYDGHSFIPLGTHANKAGRIIAENIAGHTKDFLGVVGSSVIKVFDQTYAKTGLDATICEVENIPYKEVRVKAADKASYYQGAEAVEVKLLYDPQTLVMLGVQMLGKENVGQRINTAAVAIQQKMTTEDFSQLDLAYAPPYSPVYDPLIIAAMQAKKS